MVKKFSKRIVGLIISVLAVPFLTAATPVPISVGLADAAYGACIAMGMSYTDAESFRTNLGQSIVTEEPETVSTNTVTDTFVITGYCGENYPHICNDGDATKTATGTTPTAGRTIAVDPRVIPYGTRVIIDGHTYIAEDCGGAIKGNRIDMFFNTHREALNWGRKTKTVTIIY